VRAASSLRDVVFAQIPAKQKELKDLGAKYSEKKLGDVTVSQVRPARRSRIARARAGDRSRARATLSRAPCAHETCHAPTLTLTRFMPARPLALSLARRRWAAGAT
jgi:hypothetical protein